MFRQIILFTIFTAIFAFFFHIYLMLDLNKRVYNHAPGNCRIIKGIDYGSEDIELIADEGLAFVTSGLTYLHQRSTNVRGRIFVYDLTQQSYQAEPLTIRNNNFDEKNFSPHGISSFVDKNGAILLYVISHPLNIVGGHTVEVFEYDRDSKQLIHQKTIVDPLFIRPNNLVVIDRDRFYLTNDGYYQNLFMCQIELLFLLRVGTVVYYDGHNATIVQSNLITPNGIAFDRRQQLLYVASPSAELIEVYDVNEHSLNKRVDIPLLSSPDNLFVDANNGDLWTALHPVIYQLVEYLKYPDDSRVLAPSQVIRIQLDKQTLSYSLTEPYANDGSQLAGSTVAIRYKRQLLIGTVFRQMLHCDIDEHTI